MSRKLTYTADLRTEPLAEMLTKIARHRVPGVITARSGALTKSIYFKDGYVIFARSSDHADRLGAWLQRRGILRNDELELLKDHPAIEKKRLGVVIMEEGLLTPEELHAAIQSQIEDIAWSLFAFDDGTATFDIQELSDRETIRIRLPLQQLILRGIQHYSEPKALVRRLGGRQATYRPSFSGDDVIGLALKQEEYELLCSVDAETSVYDLVKNGPLDATGNARTLYALRVLGLISTSTKEVEGASTIRIRLPVN